MIELPDDELDKLFRKSSEELDPYFDPNDWNDLKTRLDAEDGIRPAGWLRRWWPLGMLLLLLTGGLVSYLLINKEDAVTAPTAREARIASAIKRSPESKIGDNEKSPGITNEKKSEIRVKTLSGNTTLTKSKSEKILPPSRSKAGGVYLEPNRSNGKVGEGAFSSNVKKEVFESEKKKSRRFNQSLDENKRAGNTTGRPSVAEDRNSVQSGIYPKKKERSTRYNTVESQEEKLTKSNSSEASINRSDVSKKDGKNVRNEQSIDSVSSLFVNGERSVFTPAKMLFPKTVKTRKMPLPTVLSIEPEAIEKPVQTEKPSSSSPRFAVRAGYSPDLSSVGLKDFSKPGASVSLLGEFGFTKRLYFQTGVTWSNKIYSAQAADYIPKKPQHYYGPDPKSVDGTCKVFEIPVNLRYDIFQGSTSRIFAGAGSSSYHMNSEVYRYQFENENDPKIGDWRGWHGRTGWYWLSNVNASVGYEHRISKRLSLVAEPYVRIPVKKVGYGKVNLFTAGMWVSVRYVPFK